MAIIHLIRCSINLFNLHLSRRRIQQCSNRHRHDCLRSAYMDICRIHPVYKEKINSKQHLGSNFNFFLNFAIGSQFFWTSKKFILRSRRGCALMIYVTGIYESE